jgi:signal transduction histidine kinase
MVVVVTPQGRSVSTSMPDGLPDEAQIVATAKDRRTRTVDVVRDGDSYTVRTEAVGGRITQAILDRHETDEERGRILTALLIAGGVGVLLAVLVAAWLARRTVRPMAETIAMQRRFVADASHELRTPLTLLSTRAQLLSRRLHRDPGTAEDVVADVDGVVAETKTLTEILDELLTAADTRGQEQWTAVDIGSVVEEVAAAAAAAAEKSGVTLTVAEGTSAARVYGSRASLRRALTALVDNAVGHARSAVTIAVRKKRRHVEVEVSDDGPGIPEDIAPRLFDRFSGLRTEAATADGRRHYGLGLALVADVAANHHGQVAVADRRDGAGGAVFTLTLPAHG